MTAVVSPVTAACATCNGYVMLTPFRADCFLSRVETEIERARSVGSPIFVDLTNCPGSSPDKSTTVAALPDTPIMMPDETFIADEPMLVCLRDHLWVRRGDMSVVADDSTAILFDLGELCP